MRNLKEINNSLDQLEITLSRVEHELSELMIRINKLEVIIEQKASPRESLE